MDLTLLKEGIIVMIIGMGTVFFFLVIMIYAMRINETILKFVGKYFPEEIAEAKPAKKKAESTDEEVVLAIACALHKKQAV